MRRRILLAMLTISFTCVSGCERDMMSERGFRLPEGDPIAGRDVFLYMHCHECHSIAGEELPVVPLADEPYVELGGPVTRVKTFGELVTAIVNPSHKLAPGYAEELVSNNGQSKMNVYNGFMTVQELTDIVMYLQPHYDVIVPAYPLRVTP